MSPNEELPTMDHEAPGIFGVNADLLALQADGPCVRVLTPAGDPAWLITRHRQARKLLRDRRLGRGHPDPDNAPRYLDNPMMDLLRTANDFATEPEAHAQMRTLLSPYFSGGRVSAMEPWMGEIIDERVAVLAGKHPPIDMEAEYAEPVVMAMICALLGVPEEERETFAGHAYASFDPSDAEGEIAGGDLFGYLVGLVARLREKPGDNVLSGLAQTGLDDVQATSMGLLLLHAAYGATVTHTSLGIARIASDARLRDELAKNPEKMPAAVEELLRTGTHHGFMLPHYAREDIEVEDVTIRAGDLVLVDFGLANLDGSVFGDPHQVDIAREPNPHLAFAHGLWYCIGAPLARMQLRMSFTALLARFPGLRLAVPLSHLRGSEGRLGGGGVANLLVTW